MRFIIGIALVGLMVTPASATSISAVCKDISGLRFDEAGGQIKTDTDGLKAVSWSYSGDDRINDGVLILQSSQSAGGRATTEKAFVQRMQSDHWSFVSVLKDAVWIHSIYPASGHLLVMQSSSSFTNAQSSKMMTGKCQVTIR